MTDGFDRNLPLAFVFPGQGSQFPGMGQALAELSPAAAATIDEADAILGFPLSELMFEGPADILEDTWNAQPAILTISVAALRAVDEALGEPLQPSMVAGHSLGEFSALVAAGALDFPTALRVVRERGHLMKQAGSTSPGGMAAVLGLDDAAIAAVCADASSEGVVVPANRNCPGQIVISGEVPALERAMELAKGAGAKRVARLNVSIASHSPLMADANVAFGSVIDAANIGDPSVPVVGNVTGQPLISARELGNELREQMERPVDWTGSIETIASRGIHTYLELGPGAILSGLIKRIDREARSYAISDLGLGLPSMTAS